MIRVLMVCMGNICRSPTAEAVLRHLLKEHAPELPVEVDSAGTHGYHVGEPPDRRAIAHAARRGVDLSALRARRLTADDFHQFDYVLCMDETNLGTAARLRPVQGGAHFGLLMDFAAADAPREVPDPYYGVQEDYVEVLHMIEQAADGRPDRRREGHDQAHQRHDPRALRQREHRVGREIGRAHV